MSRSLFLAVPLELAVISSFCEQGYVVVHMHRSIWNSSTRVKKCTHDILWPCPIWQEVWCSLFAYVHNIYVFEYLVHIYKHPFITHSWSTDDSFYKWFSAFRGLTYIISNCKGKNPAQARAALKLYITYGHKETLQIWCRVCLILRCNNCMQNHPCSLNALHSIW